MDKPLIIKGCGTALVTPFKYGEVDLECYRSLVRRQEEAGIDFLVPLGTTAETPCLSNDEKVELLQATKEVSGNLPVIVGCGTNSLSATLKNIEIFLKSSRLLLESLEVSCEIIRTIDDYLFDFVTWRGNFNYFSLTDSR